MTGRDLLKDRSLKPVKIAESDIDVSEQGSQANPSPARHPQTRGGQLQAGLGWFRSQRLSGHSPRPCPFLILPGPLQPILVHRSS